MKTRFKGHETFFFREGWISKAMYEMRTRNNNKLFSGNNGIVKLGVGSNMVKSIKYWMITSDLVYLNYKTKLYELTELGRIISDYDVYLEDIFSLWVMHINIARNFTNATTWNLFFNCFNAKDFSVNDVRNALKLYVEQNDIKCAEKSLETDINVLLNMYSRENTSKDPEENYSCPLERLNLIKVNRTMYSKEIPNLDELDELVILYAILLMAKDANEKYISISDLESADNSLVKLLHLNRNVINEYLEQLASQSFIRIEKTAGLDIVYITTKLSDIDVVRLYFERRDNL